MTRRSLPKASLAALAFVLAVSAQPSMASDYDMDCKVILCLAGGFPEGCGDAFDHMIDRLRDGKSPVGSCTMADGRELEDVDVDLRRLGAHSAAAWECPQGSRLHHKVAQDGERREITAFCYETATQRRQGDGNRTSYAGISTPARVDLQARLRMAPGTDAAYDSGVLRFDTERHQDWRTTIRHRP